jgi:serine/threonine protein kinase
MATSVATPLAVGDFLLGKYRIERVLGRGGRGIVVAARHEGLGELFAIKLLAPEIVGSDVALGRRNSRGNGTPR